MRLNMDYKIFAGPNGPCFSSGRTVPTDIFGRKLQGNTLGSILNGSFDPIEKKREMARKQAYKIVSDTFASERKLDSELDGRADKIRQYTAMLGEANGKIREIDERKEQLRQEYGVEPDSQEQKDLELLERYNRDPFAMTLDEWDQVDAIRKQGYTDYQKLALEWESCKAPHLADRKTAKKGILEENAAIRAMDLERLKHHPVLDAVNEAEKILEDASKEIIGMLRDEAIDYIDKKFEEELEKVEERKEEKKEEQEKLEAAEERREEMEALADPEKAEQEKRRTDNDADALSGDPMTEAILRMDSAQNDMKREVSDMMMKMNLAAEDIKGIKVDALL